MWFKNLRIYRLGEAFTLTPEALAEKLSAAEFTPCGKMDMRRTGWVSPLGPEGESLTHAANGYIMISAKREDKILPAGVIKEKLEERLREIKNSEGRPVGRKERDTLKDEIIFSMLPQAFSKSAVDYAYIDSKNRLIVVNSASANRAEELLSALREALGSLPAVPLTPRDPATSVMTHWVRQQDLPKDLVLGDECELKSSSDERIIRGKKIDLSDEQLHRHVDDGMYVNQLAIHFNDALSCVIDEQLACKRLKFADTLIEQAGDGNPETHAEQFDCDFAIMTLQLTAFINALITAFGGEAE